MHAFVGGWRGITDMIPCSHDFYIILLFIVIIKCMYIWNLEDNGVLIIEVSYSVYTYPYLHL